MTRGPAPEPLPRELAEAFRIATALDAGVSPARLRARDLDASVHGVRTRTPITGLRSRCLAFAERYPGSAFSHVTAALLWGAPLPLHLERDIAVDVAVRAPRRAPHAAGVRGHRIPARPDDLAWRSGVRVTTPAWTWLDLGARLEVPDLVAVGDYLIHRDLPLTSRAELGRLLEAVPRSHGGARLRRALALLSDAAESRPESLLRVALARSGMPPAQVNRTMVRTDTGRDVRTDLSWPGSRVVVEYQGDYHRAAAQWRSDMRRRSALEAHGWTVIEANWDDVLDPEPLVARLRRLLRSEPLPE